MMKNPFYLGLQNVSKILTNIAAKDDTLVIYQQLVRGQISEYQ